jgi:integrase
VHHPALLDIGEARELLAAAERVDAARMVKLGSQFLALTAVRLAAVLGMRWSEVEDLDGSAPTWRVPAARMKLRAAKKLDAKNDHVVPLSWAAVEVLRQARDLAGGPMLIQPGDLVFEDDGGPLSDDALRSLYIRAGYAGRHVPHGWRATFATILNERFPEDHVAIDRALAHSPKDKVAAAYDRSAQLARRRRLFQAWADELVPPAAAAPVAVAA